MIKYKVKKTKKIEVEETEVVLSEQEAKLAKMCMDYCYHRLNNHEAKGIRGKINEEKLNKLRAQMHLVFGSYK